MSGNMVHHLISKTGQKLRPINFAPLLLIFIMVGSNYISQLSTSVIDVEWFYGIDLREGTSSPFYKSPFGQIVIGSFLILILLDLVYTNWIANLKQYQNEFLYTGDKSTLELTKNVLEINGVEGHTYSTISINESGIYLFPGVISYINKAKPLYFPFTQLSIKKDKFRYTFFGIRVLADKQIFKIETKYQKGFMIRIKEGELSSTFERILNNQNAND